MKYVKNKMMVQNLKNENAIADRYKHIFSNKSKYHKC